MEKFGSLITVLVLAVDVGSIVVSGVLMFLKIRIRIMNHQLQFDVSETLYRIPYAFSRETITSTDDFSFNSCIQFLLYFAYQRITIITNPDL